MTSRKTAEVPTANRSSMRRFVFNRTKDISGTSGTGIVAEGVEFSNGTCQMRWLSQMESYTTFANAKVMETIHGHGGATAIEWLDP